MKKNFIKMATLVAYIVMVTANYLAVSLPLAGRDTGEISDSYPNLFAPAGYAFSIWGVIYTLLAIYVIYQLVSKEEILIKAINRIFIVNAFLNAGWLFAWHYDLIWLSVIIMIAMLATLIKIADITHRYVKTTKDHWLVRLPFSVYFGWISVATIANITVLLVSLNWNGFGLSDVFWTVTVLIIGAIIGLWRAFSEFNLPYLLVFVWAYGAILFKHISNNGFAGQYPIIIWTAVICLVVFTTAAIIILIKERKNKNDQLVVGV